MVILPSETTQNWGVSSVYKKFLLAIKASVHQNYNMRLAVLWVNWAFSVAQQVFVSSSQKFCRQASVSNWEDSSCYTCSKPNYSASIDTCEDAACVQTDGRRAETTQCHCSSLWFSPAERMWMFSEDQCVCAGKKSRFIFSSLGSSTHLLRKWTDARAEKSVCVCVRFFERTNFILISQWRHFEPVQCFKCFLHFCAG